MRLSKVSGQEKLAKSKNEVRIDISGGKMNARKQYQWLLEHFRETAFYDSIKRLLNWDQRTCLPPGGHSHRAAQLAVLAGLLSRRMTDPQIGESLAALEQGMSSINNFSQVESVNVREWRRIYDRACKIPESLSVELARVTSEGELAWETARLENNWNSFLPHLKRIVELKRQEALALGFDDELYDGLMDDFEPGETTGKIQPLFEKLGAALVELLGRIKGSERHPDPNLLVGDSPVHSQEILIREIMEKIGYNLDGGRIDRSAHPFMSNIGPGDARITTRFDPSSFATALFSAIHETGHALYEQGLPAEHWGTPRGESSSMGIHESQSRLWENMVGRSAGFCNFLHPVAGKLFPWLEKIPPGEFHAALNAVRPSLIRTEADEVTYNLHIIMRFELELALIRGDLRPEELVEAWNDKMKKYLGLIPPDYASGVMQDVHWSGGAFGYFPSYALGTMHAAQFYAKAEQDLGSLEEMFAAGEFDVFAKWLRKNIHEQGRCHLPRDLVKVVTGEEPSPKYLIEYMNSKYRSIYNLDG
jgi:carboxypeptidase Taq